MVSGVGVNRDCAEEEGCGDVVEFFGGLLKSSKGFASIVHLEEVGDEAEQLGGERFVCRSRAGVRSLALSNGSLLSVSQKLCSPSWLWAAYLMGSLDEARPFL